MFIKDLEQANLLLKEYVPIVSQVTGKDMTLERVVPLFKALGDPQKKLKIVHVAGTSGKTSTSYFIEALLRKTGSKTGLTVSPHIDSITERIQINSLPISDTLFCKYLGECLEIVKIQPIQPSYFELLMALAYYIFAKEKVDYAVIETGMGGLHDASNIANNKDKVCVITDIGFDHMQILGHTIAEIAAQKAGIIHAGNVAYMFKQDHDVMTAIRNQCERVGASYATVQDYVIEDNSVPIYQKRNFSLALHVVGEIAKRDNLKVITDKEVKDALHTYVPARMDIVKFADSTIVMDGAHNGQKISQLVKSFQIMFPHKKAVVVIALKNGKEYKEVLQLLIPITTKFIFTSFNLTQDIPSLSIDTALLASEANKIEADYDIVSQQKEAVEAAAALSDLVLITGSFYLLAQLRTATRLRHVYGAN